MNLPLCFILQAIIVSFAQEQGSGVIEGLLLNSDDCFIAAFASRPY